MEDRLENAYNKTRVDYGSPDRSINFGGNYLQRSISTKNSEVEKPTAAIKEEACSNILEKENEVKTLQQKLHQMQKAIDCLMGFQDKERGRHCSLEVKCSSKTALLPRSKSCRPLSVTHQPLDLLGNFEESENIPQHDKSQTHLSLSLSLPAMKYGFQAIDETKSPKQESDDLFTSPNFSEAKFTSPARHSRKLSRQDSRKSVLSVATDSRTPRIKSSANRGISNGIVTRLSVSEFKRLRMEIIELWACCNVPLVHRAYFFILFKGDPSDFIYMEVELRRLMNLKNLLFDRETITEQRQTITLTSR